MFEKNFYCPMQKVSFTRRVKHCHYAEGTYPCLSYISTTLIPWRHILQPNRLPNLSSSNAYVFVSTIYLNLNWWCFALPCLPCHHHIYNSAATPNSFCKTLLSVFGLRFCSKLNPMLMVQGMDWTHDHDRNVCDEERGKTHKTIKIEIHWGKSEPTTETFMNEISVVN